MSADTPTRSVTTSCRAGHARRAKLAPRLAVAVVCLGLSGCSDERVTSVDVQALSVFPEQVTTFVGETRALRVTARDDRGQVIEPLNVVWSSEDAHVVDVASDGTAEAVAPGATRVVASFRGASASATFQVMAGPAIALTRDSVVLRAEAGGPDPDPEVIYVANGGGQSLEGLTATVDFSGAPGDWLEADLERDSAPTRLTLRTRASDLPGGVHRATVRIDAEVASNAPLDIPVVVAVDHPDSGTGGGGGGGTGGGGSGGGDDPDPDDPDGQDDPGISITETDGETEVSEGGARDALEVVLDAPPESEVVVIVASANPLEVVVVSVPILAFTPSDWDEPRTVILEGVDDLIPDGDRTVDLTILVDDALSSPEYRGLGATIPVRNRDDDGGL